MNDASPVLHERSAATGFAGSPLNRHSERRVDAAHMAELESHTHARAVLLVRDFVVLRRDGDGHGALFGLAETEAFGAPVEKAYLGHDALGPIFALRIDESGVEIGEASPGAAPTDARHWRARHRGDVEFRDLRSIAMLGLTNRNDLAILGQAKAVMNWHSRHRFCSNCGAPTEVSQGGWRRDCPACGAQHFPRTDPVVIMLAVDGGRCLLGRQKQFAPGVYSCLAGFVESGETIEEAVRRELAEEAGVAIGRVSYLASQPWPFPMSLMIGCLAAATRADLTPDLEELEDARWFTRAETVDILNGAHGTVKCPPPMAIAHHIIRAWAIDGIVP